MFKKIGNPEIRFIAHTPGLENEKELLPVPSKKYYPSWWKDIPTYLDEIDTDTGLKWGTIKKCPALPDFFSSGYIIPMWQDYTGIFHNGKLIQHDQNTYGYNFPKWLLHPTTQFLDHVDIRIGDRKPEAILKPCLPWQIITDKGWSVLVLPLFYNFNPNYTLMPGIVDTDINHQINLPHIIHSNQTNVTFKRGDPFAMIIPFKRNSYNYRILKKDNEMAKFLKDQNNKWWNGRFDGNSYRKMQKERDSE